jgi:hypothetical protein
MTLKEILQTLDDTDRLIDSGNLGAAKAMIGKLRTFLDGGEKFAKPKVDDANCPNIECNKRLLGQAPTRWCQHCGWREN